VPRGRLTLRSLVQDYISRFRVLARAELAFYAQQPTLRTTVELAALCIDPAGLRSAHQRRRSRGTLIAGRNVLTGALHGLRQCRSFQELHETIDRLVSQVPGLGELYSYDITLQIGAKLGLKPDEVYLHCGTRTGARNLGLPHRRNTIDLGRLRPELSGLTPYEIEDFLCIYKDYLTLGMA
jgi:hypothetical protein